jgi:hypothetical protein
LEISVDRPTITSYNRSDIKSRADFDELYKSIDMSVRGINDVGDDTSQTQKAGKPMVFKVWIDIKCLQCKSVSSVSVALTNCGGRGGLQINPH